MARLDADWLCHPATQRVFALLQDYPTFAVGGCVRNSLLSEPVKDVDISTAARPEMVMELAERAGLRVVPTGLSHGTVTVVVDEKPFEVTTFRRDVATDGRRAIVAFASSLDEDAIRRDFTINAIYADRTGMLADPVDGLPDIAARRVRFIENAERRIREDYLRSLRFFRFHAWYGDPDGGMDPEAMDAIARNLSGLETLSRERIGSELLRLLSAPNPGTAVAAMRATGVLTCVLPGADDTALGPLVGMEQSAGAQPDALRRLAVLGGAVETLRLSRQDQALVETLAQGVALPPREAGYRHGDEIGRDIVLVTGAVTGASIPEHALAEVAEGASASFPLCAADLMPEFQGKALGDELNRLEKLWIESNFALSKSDLLAKG